MQRNLGYVTRICEKVVLVVGCLSEIALFIQVRSLTCGILQYCLRSWIRLPNQNNRKVNP